MSTTLTKEFNTFEMAQAQFDRIAGLLELDAATRDLLHFVSAAIAFPALLYAARAGARSPARAEKQADRP